MELAMGMRERGFRRRVRVPNTHVLGPELEQSRLEPVLGPGRGVPVLGPNRLDQVRHMMERRSSCQLKEERLRTQLTAW